MELPARRTLPESQGCSWMLWSRHWTAVRITDAGGEVLCNDTPLALAESYLSDMKIGGMEATESQPHKVGAIRRFLERVVEAVHDVSSLRCWRPC